MDEVNEKLTEILSGTNPIPLYKFQYFVPQNIQEAAFLCANWHLHLTQLVVDIDKQESSESRWISERLTHLLGLCSDDNLCLWCAGDAVNV